MKYWIYFFLLFIGCRQKDLISNEKIVKLEINENILKLFSATNLNDTLISVLSEEERFLLFNKNDGKLYDILDNKKILNEELNTVLNISEGEWEKQKLYRHKYKYEKRYKKLCSTPKNVLNGRIYMCVMYFNLEVIVRNDTNFVNLNPKYILSKYDIATKKLNCISEIKLWGDGTINSDYSSDFFLADSELFIGNYVINKYDSNYIPVWSIYTRKNNSYSFSSKYFFPFDTMQNNTKLQSSTISNFHYRTDKYFSHYGTVYNYRKKSIVFNFHAIIDSLLAIKNFMIINNNPKNWYMLYQHSDRSNYICIIKDMKIIYRKRVEDEIYFTDKKLLYEIKMEDGQYKLISKNINI